MSDVESMRVLAAHVLTQCRIVLGHDIESIKHRSNPRYGLAYTVDHNDRPAFVAVIMAILERPPAEYPESGEIAQLILMREEGKAADDAESEVYMTLMLGALQANVRANTGNPRAALEPGVARRLKLFANVLTAAIKRYGECVRRHRLIAQDAGLNLSFSIDYVKIELGMQL